jgi:hypothetical protein
VLPDEPSGYHGYRARYGSKFIQPVISPSGPVRNLNGAVIKDSSGNIGFPGYNGMTGPNALAYTLDLQLHGVQVTDTYLSDLHESWTGSGPFGPGQPGYESQLRAENAAFGTFFSQLAAHGITRANTLFVITADEGDHFAGSAATPSGCNGVKIICHYSRIGEVNGNLTTLLAAKGITTPFDVNADASPSIYVHGQPARTSSSVRALERSAATLTGHDLATGQTGVRLTNYLADPVELKILHMVTGDPKRTPSAVLFGNTDFWLENDPTICGTSVTLCEPAGGDAWNHGTVGSQINTTWLGMAGPGVARLGVDNAVWSDHTSIHATRMACWASPPAPGSPSAGCVRRSRVPTARRRDRAASPPLRWPRGLRPVFRFAWSPTHLTETSSVIDHRHAGTSTTGNTSYEARPRAGSSGLLSPQLTAFFTSAPILASAAAVNSVRAKAVGHMAPSSRFALSLKPSVAYLVLNFCLLWKKQTTLPSLAYAGIPYQVLGKRAGALALMMAWSRSAMARSGSGISAIFASTALSPSALSACGPRRAAAFSSWARSFIAPRSSSVNPSTFLSVAVVLLADFCVSFIAGLLPCEY